MRLCLLRLEFQYLTFQLMIKKTSQKWITFAKQNKRAIYFYQNKVLDLTEFSLQHPGGKKALDNYIYKDITEILFKVYPHNKQPTLQKLSKYVIGLTTQDDSKRQKNDRSMSKNSDKSQKQKKKVCFKKKDTNKSLQQQKQSSPKKRQKQVSKSKQKKDNKSSSKNITPKNKENNKVKKQFQVSIKCIPNGYTSKSKIEESSDKTKKLKKYESQWETNASIEELLQQKAEICFPYFITKSKQNL